MASSEAQKLIALSLGKIAMSRQQRGGINLHKNLLVASVLHKARTTYMMDNFQTLIANKKAQAEKEAAAKMIVETPSVTSADSSEIRQSESMEVGMKSRGDSDCSRVNNQGAPSGERPELRRENAVDKENVVPDNRITDNNVTPSYKSCDQENNNVFVKDTRDNSAPSVTVKQPLSSNNGRADYVSAESCRCAGGKRRRSFVDSESATQPKKPRYEEEYENRADSDSDTQEQENMQTETTQVSNLVNIFNTGFNGLLKEDPSSQKVTTGQVNVYVSADRSVSGHHYVLSEVSCATQYKDVVTVPTAIALAV